MWYYTYYKHAFVQAIVIKMVPTSVWFLYYLIPFSPIFLWFFYYLILIPSDSLFSNFLMILIPSNSYNIWFLPLQFSYDFFTICSTNIQSGFTVNVPLASFTHMLPLSPVSFMEPMLWSVHATRFITLSFFASLSDLILVWCHPIPDHVSHQVCIRFQVFCS